MSTFEKRGRGKSTLIGRTPVVLCALVLSFFSLSAHAQGDLRYSWFEISYVAQDVSRSGAQISLADPTIPQLVEIDAGDGDGIKFRGSIGTWHNLYAFVDFSSSDIDVTAVVTNTVTGVPAEPVTDEFDYTAIRGGLGLRIPLRPGLNIYGEVSYDSLDLDFGSFTGNPDTGDNFDTDAQDIGAAIGIRTLLTDKLELRAYGRYTKVGDVNINIRPGTFDADTLYGVGFGIELIRGLSITGDYESGEFTNWNIGFRLDLSED